MRVLLDTCVLSELRRTEGNPGVRRAVEAFSSDDLFVSVLSVGEIAKGIALLKNSRKKRILQAWLQTLERSYTDRCFQWISRPAAFGVKSPRPRRRAGEPYLSATG